MSLEYEEIIMTDNIKIAILSCLKATEVCSGAACFKAINSRVAFFEPYKDKNLEVMAFFHCNGCDCDYENDSDYLEKINRVCAMQVDAVHIGKCTLIDGVECQHITKIVKHIEDAGIRVIRGTH